MTKIRNLLATMGLGSFLSACGWGVLGTDAGGIKGATGSSGPEGPTGLAGEAGSPGSKGSNGVSGSVGPTGTQGEIGPTGPTGTIGLQGPSGSNGPTGPTGALTHMVSYYTDNSNSAPVVGGGVSLISFNSPNTILGSHVSVISGSTISFAANGTYLLTVSGVAQMYVTEAWPAAKLEFFVALEQQTQGGGFSNVQPYPLSSYNIDSQGLLIYLTTAFHISHVINVTQLPFEVRVKLNNSATEPMVLINPILNVIQLN